MVIYSTFKHDIFSFAVNSMKKQVFTIYETDITIHELIILSY